MSTTARRPALDVWQQVPATWKAYLGLVRARGDSPRPRYTYLRGRLTIVSPANPHEWLRKRLGWFVEEIFLGLSIPFLTFGGATLLKTIRPRTGTEPDESYYLTHIEGVRGKENLVMGMDPPPDLVIEVVVSHPVTQSLAAYREFGVREVWVCGRSEVVFLVLGQEGRYEPSPTSRWLPFVSSEEMTSWVYREDQPDEAELRRLFRRWVVEVLAPRRPAPGVREQDA